MNQQREVGNRSGVCFSERAKLASGQPIGKLMAVALANPELISLAAGFVDNTTLPLESATAALQSLTAKTDLFRRGLQYDSSAGNVELRQALSAWCYRDWMSVTPSSDRLMLTAGSNQALHLAAEAVINPGDIVIAAAPTYFVFMGTLRGLGATVIGVKADEDGLVVSELDACLQELARQGKADRVKLVYTVTDFDNPAGSSLSLDRRTQLLQTVERWRAEYGPLLVFSDMAYQHLRFDGVALPPLLALNPSAADYVFEFGTFSKSYSPGIRVGWMTTPEPFVSTLHQMKSNMDFGSPHFAQALMLEALRLGMVDEHIPQIVAAYRMKRDAMLEALEEELAGIDGVRWRNPAGGLYVWVTLPESTPTDEASPLWQAALDEGVLYVPGHYCFPEEGARQGATHTMRLSFGVQSANGIRKGIAGLGRAIKSTVMASA